jgi:thioredoxin 1
MNSSNTLLRSLRSFKLANATQLRPFSLISALNSNIYNVQDEQDFKKRVIQNSKPVIVDFHAM